MSAIDLVRALMSEGVEFATDGERIRWRNSEGRMTPETVAQIAAAKPEVIDFLTRKPRPAPAPAAYEPDPETYHAFLRSNGLTTYGAVAAALQWGATRAWQAEARLRAMGRARCGENGKTYVVETDNDPRKE